MKSYHIEPMNGFKASTPLELPASHDMTLEEKEQLKLENSPTEQSQQGDEKVLRLIKLKESAIAQQKYRNRNIF